jgi:hypothetical protein
MLVNAAEVRESLFYILGGQPEWITVPSEDAPLRVGFVMSLELEREELGRRFDLVASLEDDDGETGRTVISVEPTRRGDSAYVAGAPLLVNATGIWRIALVGSGSPSTW